ncbi:ricin-type beta-trefoil lectin domain protein [Kribbella sp. NPDC056951]|uniref:RICIN domain-containing protein n=1 Tax=Kribbella sp. NPDC056951 TaxID=3345978 RepID=UPI003644B93B
MIGAVLATTLAAPAATTRAVATPEPAASSFRIQNLYSSLCLVNYSRNDKAYMGNCQNDAYRFWVLDPIPNGKYRIRNVRNGSCLDVFQYEVYGHTCNSAEPDQDWEVNLSRGLIRNPQWARCLRISGPRDLLLVECDPGSLYQLWRRV